MQGQFKLHFVPWVMNFKMKNKRPLQINIAIKGLPFLNILILKFKFVQSNVTEGKICQKNKLFDIKLKYIKQTRRQKTEKLL